MSKPPEEYDLEALTSDDDWKIRVLAQAILDLKRTLLL